MNFLMAPHDGNDFSGDSGRTKRSEWRRELRQDDGSTESASAQSVSGKPTIADTGLVPQYPLSSSSFPIVSSRFAFVEHAVRRLLKKKHIVTAHFRTFIFKLERHGGHSDWHSESTAAQRPKTCRFTSAGKDTPIALLYPTLFSKNNAKSCH
jgi:hypothetical protein